MGVIINNCLVLALLAMTGLILVLVPLRQDVIRSDIEHLEHHQARRHQQQLDYVQSQILWLRDNLTTPGVAIDGVINTDAVNGGGRTANLTVQRRIVDPIRQTEAPWMRVPEPVMAVGPSIVITMVNEGMIFSDKMTTSRRLGRLDNLFLPAFPNANLVQTPHIHFDEASQRFFVVAESTDTTIGQVVIGTGSSVDGSYMTRSASFGPQEFDVTGVLVKAEPFLADAPLDAAQVNGKIVVILRGITTFSSKVQFAADAGAIGVIIVNNVVEFAGFLPGIDPGFTIPTLWMNNVDGLQLVAALDAAELVGARLTRPVPYHTDMFVAVSKTAKPTTSHAANWYTYQLPTSLYAGVWATKPKSGTDDQLLYIATHDVTRATLAATDPSRNDFWGDLHIVAVDKHQLLNGSGATVVWTYSEPNHIGFTSWPALVCPPTADVAQQMFFVSTDLDLDVTMPIRHLNLLATQPLDRRHQSGVGPALRRVRVDLGNHGSAFRMPPAQTLAQPPAGVGPVAGLDHLSGTITSAVVARDSVWATYASCNDETCGHSVVHWVEIDIRRMVSQNIATVKQHGVIDVAPHLTTSAFSPSIHVNADGGVALSFQITGPHQYPAIAYTGRLATDPTSTMRMPAQIVAQSSNSYERLTDDGRNQWGGFTTSLARDPLSRTTFWTIGQYADNQPDLVINNRSMHWATSVAMFAVSPGLPTTNASASQGAVSLMRQVPSLSTHGFETHQASVRRDEPFVLSSTTDV